MNTEKLEQLYSLKEKGVITEEEFQSQKELLLKENLVETASKISMVEAYKSYWRHSFKWQGRATRAEFWWPVLVNFLIALGAEVLLMIPLLGTVFAFAYILFWFASIFPTLSVIVRRYHDLGHSAWFAFIPELLILGLGGIAIIDYVLTYAGVSSEFLSNARVIVYTVSAFILIITEVIWMYVFPCFKGQNKPNKYGDPR